MERDATHYWPDQEGHHDSQKETRPVRVKPQWRRLTLTRADKASEALQRKQEGIPRECRDLERSLKKSSKSRNTTCSSESGAQTERKCTQNAPTATRRPHTMLPSFSSGGRQPIWARPARDEFPFCASVSLSLSLFLQSIFLTLDLRLFCVASSCISACLALLDVLPFLLFTAWRYPFLASVRMGSLAEEWADANSAVFCHDSPGELPFLFLLFPLLRPLQRLFPREPLVHSPL